MEGSKQPLRVLRLPELVPSRLFRRTAYRRGYVRLQPERFRVRSNPSDRGRFELLSVRSSQCLLTLDLLM